MPGELSLEAGEYYADLVSQINQLKWEPSVIGKIIEGSPGGESITKGGFLLDTRSRFPRPTMIVSTPVRHERGSARETLRRENPERGSRPGFLSLRSY